MAREVSWQLVGVADVRVASVPSSACTVQDLKTAIEAEIHIGAKWLRVMHAGEELDAHSSLPSESSAGDEAQNIFMVCLVLPAFALLCSQPWFTRRSRTRVRNQHAVRALAWQPGLLTHEEDQILPDEALSKSFPVFIGGIHGLPSKFLRVDLQSTTPTVGQLRTKLQEILPEDSNATFSYESQVLQNNRQYLHRLNISSGAVVQCCIPHQAVETRDLSAAEAHGLDEGGGSSCHIVSSQNSSSSRSDVCEMSSTVGSSIGSNEEEGEDAECVISADECDQEQAPAEKNKKRRPTLSAHTGKIWSASSRRKLLSGEKCTGKSALMSAPLSERQAGVEEPQVWGT